MSLIPIGDLDQYLDPVLVDEGQYDLRIKSVKVKEEGDQTTGFLVVFTIPARPDAGAVFHNVTLPTPDMDDEKRRQCGFFLKKFCHALGIPGGNINSDMLIGRECTALVEKKEYQGQWSNRVKNFILPS